MPLSLTLDPSVITPGFDDPVAGAQLSFRMLLEAMACPGLIVALPPLAAPPPAPLGPATAAVALTLLDIDTPVWVDQSAAPSLAYPRFHSGCVAAERLDSALFALVVDPAALPPLTAFNLGTDEFPDRSTTLILQVSALQQNTGGSFFGPGIRERRRLDVGGLSERFWSERAELHELFPRGLDVIFTCGDQLAALPRTTRREMF